MTKIVFISDFFANEIRGGAELCNDALIKLLRKKYDVTTVKSSDVNPYLLQENLNSFFIIANFFMLIKSLNLLIYQNLKKQIINSLVKF